MAIILQVELMEPDMKETKRDVKKHGGKALRQFGRLLNEAIPGDGIICLYSFPSLKDAEAFVLDCFGDDPDECGHMTETVKGIFYTHNW